MIGSAAHVLDDLPNAAGRGDGRAVGRAISRIEREDLAVGHFMTVSDLATCPSHVIGLTGAPGVGKSTALTELIGVWRALGKTVGVLAVDPTSQDTGGAVLGDRARMTQHTLDPGVFIRSMATRGHLGGLARATPQAVQALMIAGFDIIAVETVGVGQSEVEVSDLVDTTCVLVAPEMGDALQAVKAGITEIADVFIVTKAELPGAHDAIRSLRAALPSPVPQTGWRTQILPTSAVETSGFDRVVDVLEAHRVFTVTAGHRRDSFRSRCRHQIIQRAAEQFATDTHLRHTAALEHLVDEVSDGLALDAAGARLLKEWRAASANDPTTAENARPG